MATTLKGRAYDAAQTAALDALHEQVGHIKAGLQVFTVNEGNTEAMVDAMRIIALASKHGEEIARLIDRDDIDGFALVRCACGRLHQARFPVCVCKG